MKENFNVTNMSCAACVARVEKAVGSLNGINSVSVNLLQNTMQVDFDEKSVSIDNIISAVENAGYGATKKGDTKKAKNDASPKNNSGSHRLIVSIIFLIPLLYVSMGTMLFSLPLPDFLAGDKNTLARALIQFLLCLPILYVNSSYFTNGFSSLFKRSPNMDTLVALGASASMIWGIVVIFKMNTSLANGDIETLVHLQHNLYIEGAATITTLVTVGKTLEAKSRIKTGEALKKLVDLTPKTAQVERDGKVISVLADEVGVGDVVLVRAGESFPVDAVVIEGTGDVDESCVTGESIPVFKQENDKVITATILKSGFLKVRATHTGSDTLFAKIIELVYSAQSGKAPIARFADKIAGVFVPVVMGISLITFIVWQIISHDVSLSLTHAISVLVISCPCAMGLATPVAITVGTGKGAQNGILIKSAEILETLHSVDTVVFDKTGTLTLGTPVMKEVIPHNVSREELLSLAYTLEVMSEHPLSVAVTKGAQSENVPLVQPENFKTLAGRGVECTRENKICLGGNRRLMQEQGIDISEVENIADEKSREGKTPLFFACDGKINGIITVADTVKEDAKQTVSLLQKSKKRVVMLTGDNKNTAEGIAKELSISEVFSEVLPDKKEEVIKNLQNEGRRVAMTGDGINDAPALARADVGIAQYGGTDIARESSDVVLLNSSLLSIFDATELSRATMRNIKQNLFWAFFYNCLGIPLAAGVFVNLTGWTLSPMFAAAAMSLSSIFVVTNALRLRNFKMTNNKKIKTKEKKMEIKIEGMMCAHCKAHVEKALEKVEGVEKFEVSLETKSAKIEGSATIDEIKRAIEEAGYKVI